MFDFKQRKRFNRNKCSKIDISINNDFFRTFVIAIYVIDHEICQSFESCFKNNSCYKSFDCIIDNNYNSFVFIDYK